VFLEISLTIKPANDYSATIEGFTVMDGKQSVDALGALAQEHRLAAFRILVQAGKSGLAAGAIAERLGLPNSSLSFHLAHLTRAGLITQRRQSRSLIYTADYSAMNALIGFLTENCCNGGACETDAARAPEAVPGRERKSA
jgi:ArsR family transcriptional regulator, arsenate/arsenite/antimonite-responsive transcriptional repressor